MNKHYMEIKKNRYIGCIYSYGIYPVLLVLKEHEQSENYEECKCILSAITQMNKVMVDSDPLPTILPNDYLERMRLSFELKGFTGNYAIINIPMYIEIIKKETTL